MHLPKAESSRILFNLSKTELFLKKMLSYIYPEKILWLAARQKLSVTLYLSRSFIFPYFIMFSAILNLHRFFMFWEIFISFATMFLLFAFLFSRKILIPSALLEVLLFFLIISFWRNLDTFLYMGKTFYKKVNIEKMIYGFLSYYYNQFFRDSLENHINQPKLFLR